MNRASSLIFVLILSVVVLFPDDTLSYDPASPDVQVDSLMGPSGLYYSSRYEWGKKYAGKTLFYLFQMISSQLLTSPTKKIPFYCPKSTEKLLLLLLAILRPNTNTPLKNILPRLPMFKSSLIKRVAKVQLSLRQVDLEQTTSLP